MIRFAAFALAAMVGSAAAQQYTMKLSTSTSGDALVEWLNTFARGVNAGSGGKVKAEVYPASQLGSIPRTIEGVALGTIEVSFNASGFYRGSASALPRSARRRAWSRSASSFRAST